MSNKIPKDQIEREFNEARELNEYYEKEIEKLKELIQVVCCNKCTHLKDDICTFWKKESGFQTKVEKPDEHTCTGFYCPLPIIDSEEEF